jgi:thiol:disulfide interchange protein/DsbC/DsbD-like thiol-disulfide interchange protein
MTKLDAHMIGRARQFLIAMLLVIVGFAGSAIAQPAPASGASEHVEITLKSARNAVAPGETFSVVIDQKIARGWHTYWRNPGDSGEPTAIDWTLPAGVTASAITWPAPTAIPFGPLVNYGFSDRVTLPVSITVPASAKVGETIDLIAAVRWLECSDICIPGQAKVGLSVSVAASSTDSADAPAVAEALAALPTPFEGTTALTDLGSGGLQLIVKGVAIPRDAYFFPYEVKNGAIIDPAQPQELVRGKDGFGLTLVKSPSFPSDITGPVEGVLIVGKGDNAKAFVINAPFEAATEAASASLKASPVVAQTSLGLIGAIGFAFLGGLILNLMPCVFPILSMKALSLIEASHGQSKAARAHGIWYGLGVVVSFLLLAGMLIGAQAAGTSLGWGFQLQNPAIVIGLAVLMVLIGFNLLGFFEIGGAIQSLGSERAHGSFLTGVLAVVVAAPCTAPFMGAALGFAATQSAPISLLVFGALGIGFALPFVVLTFAPALLRALPKPGPWMVTLRGALAFPMLATAIWLVWVVTAQSGQAGVLAALVAVFGAGFGVWIMRTWDRPLGKFASVSVILASLVWAGFHATNAPPRPLSQATQNQFGETWSPTRVTQLTDAGKTVFVNFTADWCVTCKVNEVGAFQDPRVTAALNGTSATYLVADWTSRNEEIATALASHGRVGVPLYLVYKPGQDQPEILPQLLTADAILRALQ